MRLIYSNVPPLKIKSGDENFTDYFETQIANSDEVCCIVGYASKKAIIELDRLVREKGIRKVVLVLGMYCIEGFPESIYNTAVSINEGWHEDGIGEIRVTKSMKYHGKLYGFYRDGKIISATVGSHNLGALVVDANNMRQYELSVHTEDENECSTIDGHIKAVINAPVSFSLKEIEDITIIREENQKLDGVEGVTKVSMADVVAFKNAQTSIRFDIPLKVPGMPGSIKDYMKSNINKCYAKGRLNTRSGVVTERGWWETEIIVGTDITTNPDYPEKNVPFYVITDDGWKFLTHASGDHKKNFESEGDLKILGYWLKGRLVAAGVVEPVDSPSEDLTNVNEHLHDIYRNCKGVITYPKLKSYGRTSLTLTKTLNKLADDNGYMRDVWLLSFLPETVK